LQRSGVGDADLLKSLDIPEVVNAPSVGRNMREHLIYTMQFDIRGVTNDPRTGVNVVPSVSEGVIVASARVVQPIKEGITGVTCVHHGHMPELALTGDTTATGIWSMEDVLKWPDDSPIESMHGFGHYFETYEKMDGHWKIKTLKITRLMLDIKLR
jgi:choline dehydrogenase-like flavoprotein